MVCEEVLENTEGIKKTRCLKNLSFYFTEYCDNTSIHGLKFLGERKRSIIENFVRLEHVFGSRIWWIIFVSISLYFCTTLIMKTYRKWINAPVLVSFATSETQIWEIPFPAVTICPLTTSEKSEFNVDLILNGTDIDYSDPKLHYISLVCTKIRNRILAENNTGLDYNTVAEEVNDFLIDVCPNLTKTIYSYKWLAKEGLQSPERIFTPILTSGGVCYSFNMLDREEIFTKRAALKYYEDLQIKHQPKSEWTVEDGYPQNANFNSFPRRTLITGTHGGLELTLYTAGEDLSQNCRDFSQGFKIILHQPGEIPRFQKRYFWVSLDQIVSATVTPNMMATSADLANYHPLDRKCYFINERSLKFFHIYNQQNCFFECLSNFTYQKCDCVGFYMLRDKTTPICGPSKAPCLREANIEFITREATFKKKASRTNRIDCNCLPSCYSLNFDAETSQLNWNWQQGNGLNDSIDNKTSHFSRLRIFFKDHQFMTSERNELYGQAEFWANCGGLVGLFTGFSIISFVEIIYFITLRMFCNIRRYGWNNWSGAEELLKDNTA